jgi:UDP:flavonoid glycosyltransferase YjiC (YdhE family)
LITKPQIEIGGFHVKNDTKPLPDDIKSFIESAKDGVIFFSLGGNLKPSKMKEEKKQAIVAALTKLKQKVIWKWDDESIKVDTKKFMIRKWFPQDDILAHDNVKLFVTHGGLLSCTESILRGKPIVGIPVFGDQTVRFLKICLSKTKLSFKCCVPSS